MNDVAAWHVTVTIRPKAGLRDPDGATIEDALHALGYEGVAGVHVGRTVTFGLGADDAEAARQLVREMCEKILANPVIEDFEIDLARAPEHEGASVDGARARGR